MSSLWRAALMVLVSLAPGAAWVSVVNDLTDRDDDRAAGKPNRLDGASPLTAAALVAATAGAGVAVAVLWRRDTLLLTAYLAAWLAFALYSLPPFRFKTRGILGVLCDAGGAHLFPTLVAVLLACREAHQPPRVAWLAAVGAWAFANGLRGILWHQLTDREHDRMSNVHTFAQRHAPEVAIRAGTWIAFPVELLALAAMLAQIGSAWPVAFLALYSIVAAWRLYRWRMNAVIVAPKPRFLIVLHEYYDVYLPLAILIAAGMRHPRDFIVLALHVLLFPNRLLQTIRDLAQLGRDGFYKR